MRVKIKGQTSVILILLAAVALVFFAISLNWGRIAQVKTLTMMASTTAAANTASSYASYAERVLQTALGGQWQICKKNSIWAALLSLILLVLIIVIGFLVCGGCTMPAATAWASSMVLASLAVALSVANLVLQVVVVQPGMSRLWNSMQLSSMPLQGQIMEQGLQSAIQSVTTDQAQLTDYFDENTNGRFGASVTADDTINRFGFFYTERLKTVKSPGSADLEKFLDGLSAFINPKPPGDDVLTIPCVGANDPHCNPCCQPVDYGGTPLRPADCSTDTYPPGCRKSLPWCDSVVQPASCGWPHGFDYPLVYDPTYPDYSNPNNFLSRFGIDAEVKPFVEDDAKGMFKFLWDMDVLQGDPNAQPAAGDNRFSDKVGISDHFKFQPLIDGACVNALPADQASKAFWWVKGADIYCSTKWPYDQCGGLQTCDGDICSCSSPTDDALDDFIYGIKQFDAWAMKLLAQDHRQLVLTLDRWYPQAAQWIGPPCDPPGSCSDSFPGLTPPGCVLCYDNKKDPGAGGLLFTYSKRLGYWEPLLTKWLTDPYADDNAWCVPTTMPTPPYTGGWTAKEINFINNGDGTPAHPASTSWGDLQSTLNCLDYNSHNADPAPPAAYKSFKACRDKLDHDCPLPGGKPSECQDLPRSLAGPAPAFSCAAASVPPAPMNYRAWVESSYARAAPQSVKFTARKTMLQEMKDNATNALAAITAFKANLDKFINGPAVKALIRARKNFSTQQASLPNSIIYGWRDPGAPKSGSRNEGYWHVVRAQATMPGYLAWVRTWTEGFLGMTRCFALTDYAGTTKVNVSRWDEEHDNTVSFANSVALWKAKFSKPGSSSGSVEKLDSACAGVSGETGDLTGWKKLGINTSTVEALTNAHMDSNTSRALAGAFMLNGQPEAGSPGEACWNAVAALLEQGVSTRTCAQYYGSGAHMSVKFTGC